RCRAYWPLIVVLTGKSDGVLDLPEIGRLLSLLSLITLLKRMMMRHHSVIHSLSPYSCTHTHTHTHTHTPHTHTHPTHTQTHTNTHARWHTSSHLSLKGI